MSAYELSGSDRVMIRRALVLYAQHFMSQKVQHVRAGNADDAKFDQARIDAIDALGNRLRLSDSASVVAAACLEPDPYETIRRLCAALRAEVEIDSRPRTQDEANAVRHQTLNLLKEIS